jgi:hypothetical protein
MSDNVALQTNNPIISPHSAGFSYFTSGYTGNISDMMLEKKKL